MNVRGKVASALLLMSAVLGSCGGQNVRGIADKRSDFRKFLPMTVDPARDGLKAVRPYFKRADRAQILRAIESSCAGAEHKRGSSVFREESGTGYYVNCNPQNRQLLNGFVAANRREAPHSRP